MPAPFWLYRFGHESLRSGFPAYRAIWTDTWLSEQPEVTPQFVRFSLGGLTDARRFMFGAGPHDHIWTAHQVSERLWPRPGWRNGFGPRIDDSPLNPNAREAAFRLQRVGAGGALGRMFPPILDDRWFTDLPARRHVDAPYLQGQLELTLNLLPNSIVSPYDGRTYQNVVFSRKTFTWQQVSRYRILANPARLWTRYYPYDAFLDVHNPGFIPNEIE